MNTTTYARNYAPNGDCMELCAGHRAGLYLICVNGQVPDARRVLFPWEADAWWATAAYQIQALPHAGAVELARDL